MILQRHLDPIESNLKNSAPSRVAEYHGHLDVHALARAFEILCTHHPVLRGRILPDKSGDLLYVSPENCPNLTVFEGDENDLRRAVNAPWDITESLSQFILVRGTNHGFVAMRVDHSIVDGRSFFALWHQLWRIYTDLTDGNQIPMSTGASLPLSPYELIKERWPGYVPSLDATDLPKLVMCKSIERFLRLSEEDTARFVAVAREREVSVHGLLCGTVLISLRDQSTTTEPATMVCWSPVDLRSRVRPPVGATESTNFSARHKATVSVPLNGDPVAVGEEVFRQLTSALNCADISFDPVISPPAPVDSSLEQRLATTMISNTGIIRRLAQPSGLRLIDLHALKSGMTVMFPTYSFSTYEGRLRILIDFPSNLFTDDEVDQIVKRTIARITAIGS